MIGPRVTVVNIDQVLLVQIDPRHAHRAEEIGKSWQAEFRYNSIRVASIDEIGKLAVHWECGQL